MSVETTENHWDQFLSALLALNNVGDMNEFLKLFLTPEEQESMSLRIALISDLLIGESTQREISKNLGISIAKITRGSNALKQISPAFKEKLIALLSEPK